MEKGDITLPIGGGYVNMRAGAIIIKNNMLLMAGNDKSCYLYSVGGRIRFGETAEEAIIREVYEETGVKMETDGLGFIHENYFRSDMPPKAGRLIYEISFYFYMKVPEDFEPVSMSFTEGKATEYLQWVSPDTEKTIYPEFFRDAVFSPCRETRHIVTDERNAK